MTLDVVSKKKLERKFFVIMSIHFNLIQEKDHEKVTNVKEKIFDPVNSKITHYDHSYLILFRPITFSN